MNQDYIKSITEALLVMEARTKEEEIEFGRDSALKPGFRKYGNCDFDAQLHGPAQAKERQPKWSEDDWEDLFKRGHEALKSPGKQLDRKGYTRKKVDPGQALVYSMSKQQGFVVNVEHKVPGEPKQGLVTRLITTLPPKKSTPAEKTTQRILIEGIEGMEFTQDQIIYIE
jgi:hypothetical protein